MEKTDRQLAGEIMSAINCLQSAKGFIMQKDYGSAEMELIEAQEWIDRVSGVVDGNLYD